MTAGRCGSKTGAVGCVLGWQLGTGAWPQRRAEAEGEGEGTSSALRDRGRGVARRMRANQRGVAATVRHGSRAVLQARSVVARAGQ